MPISTTISSFKAASPVPSFSRATWAEINLDALLANACVLREVAAVPLLAVIKANAYGHGAEPVADALLNATPTTLSVPGVRMLGVASVDEGVQLREAGVTAPILLLSALLPEEAPAVVRAHLTPTVFTVATARALQQAAAREERDIAVHVKLDTGMTRLGVWCEAGADFVRRLREWPRLRVEGLYTHLACADEPDDAMTSRQLEAFQRALDECEVLLPTREVLRHAANSAATLRYAAARFDMVRPGIALYGISPFGDVGQSGGESFQPRLELPPLRPVMTLRARITNVREVPAGTDVSYGATWRAARATRLATVPVGYADGYPRALSNRAWVLLRGQRCPVVGRVTMDQILVDCTDLTPAVQIGEIVTLWGEGLPAEEVATWAGTIAYELLCGVAPRVPRVYLEAASK